MNKHALARGSFLTVFVLLFSQLVFEQSPILAAAEADQTIVNSQYLPITFAESCIPRSLISPSDPNNDLTIEEGINDVRANQGMPKLMHSSKVAQAALRHSNDMAFNGITDHIGSDGSDPGDRLSDACYQWQAYGEILAGGYRNPADAITAWMESPSHKEIILSELFTEFGAGYVYKRDSKYSHYYTVDFGVRDTTFATIRTNYFTCHYSTTDDRGEIWLNLYSIRPCDELFSSLSGGG